MLTIISCHLTSSSIIPSLSVLYLKPGIHTNDYARFMVAARVFTDRLRKTKRRIKSRRIVFRRRSVNTCVATVNRGEIVSMYAGLNTSTHCFRSFLLYMGGSCNIVCTLLHCFFTLDIITLDTNCACILD